MISKTITILESSRVFSLPMTILSWLIVFTFSVINSGNIFYGILALIGLCFVHLGTNLVDDFLDYKFLIKMVDFDKEEYMKNSQKTKCRYLISGMMSEKQLVMTICIYFIFALLCGLYLYVKCGVGVLYYALIGAIIALSYPLLSRVCLSEFAVALAYGPALFGGVYYVMTGAYLNEIFILSIPSAIMTVVLLYIHTVMDYDFDKNEKKKTIANSFESQLDSLKLLKIFLFIAYVSVILLCIFDILDWQVFLVYLTIPLAMDLYKSLSNFVKDSSENPVRKWYHFPMEKLAYFEKRGEASFMFRMFQARNLMLYFSLLFTIAIILSLGL